MSLNIKTPDGLQEIGKVTKEKISTALGYDPASIDAVDHIDAEVKEHIEDDRIHVSSQDKQRWDAKSDLSNIVDDASAQLDVIDTAGNKIVSVSADGVSTTKVTAKELVVNGTNVTDTLQELDSNIGSVSSKHDAHKNNTTVHITANERDKWNSKSDLPNITDDQSGNFILSDSSGNIIFKVSEAGSETTALTAKAITVDGVDVKQKLTGLEAAVDEHSDNLEIHVTAQEKDLWTNKSDFTGQYADLQNAPNIYEDNSDSLHFADNNGNRIVTINEDGIQTTEVTANKVAAADMQVNGLSVLDNLYTSEERAAVDQLVTESIKTLRDNAPTQLDTLNKIAAAINNDGAFAESVEDDIQAAVEGHASNTTLHMTAVKHELLTTTASEFDLHSTNSTRHITADERTSWNNKSDFSGNYVDLSDAPSITNNEAGSLIIADEAGSKIAAIDANGIETTKVLVKDDLVIADGTADGLSVKANLFTEDYKTEFERKATIGYVNEQDEAVVTSIVADAPTDLNTLQKLAAAIDNDSAFSETIAHDIEAAVKTHADRTDLHMNATQHQQLSDTAAELDKHVKNTVTHITDAERVHWNAKSEFSGKYIDLEDAPTIQNTEDNSLLVVDNAGLKIVAVTDNGIETTKVFAHDDLVLKDESVDGLSVRENLFTENYKTALTNKADQNIVDQQIDALIDGAPADLNTLNKIAVSINNDSNYAATVDGKLDTKLPITTFTDHLNSSMHITSAERTQISANTSAIEQHKSDLVSHVTAAEKETWNNKSDFSGEYAQLQNAPAITNAEDKSFIIVDPDGFKVAEVSESGFSTKIVATKTTYATDDFIIGAPTDENSISVKENLYTETRQAELDQKFSAVEANKASKHELTTAVNNIIAGEQELTSFKKVAEAIDDIHEHSNMTVLDSITADAVSNWDSKAAGDHDHKELYAPIGHPHNYVTSVNTKEGAVTLYANDVGALPNTTKLADLETDADHRTVSDTEKSGWDAKAAGDHNHDGAYAPPQHEHPYITSVNGDTGPAVELSAADVGALPASTTLASLSTATGDANHRLVTEEQMSTWDSKADGGHDHNGIYEPIRPNGYVESIKTSDGTIKQGEVTLTATDISALPSDTTLADLLDDETHRLVTDGQISAWDNKEQRGHKHKFINRSVVSDTGTTIAFNIVSQDATTTKEDLENSNIPADFSQVVAVDGGSLSVGSADKLTAARSINLTGDVSGNGTFDGSQDVSIAVTVDKDKVLNEFQANLDQNLANNFVTNNTLESTLSDYALKTDLPSVPAIVDDLDNGQPTADKTLSARLGKEISEQIEELASTVEKDYATKDYVNTDKNKILNYISYTINTDNTVTITGCHTRITGAHVIPSTIEGYPVTTIRDHAFSQCIALKSITIPASVTTIGDSAFYYCTSLTSVTIPDSVTSIGERAFEACSSLKSIIIPDGVTTIGQFTFSHCSSLTSVTIPDSVTIIGSCAFQYCTSLTSVTIPASFSHRDSGTSEFQNCTSLTSVTIKSGVKALNFYFFKDCTALTSVSIPASITQIQPGVFSGCEKLSDIYYDSSKEDWEAISTDGNTILSTVTIHYNQAIATEAFVTEKLDVVTSLLEEHEEHGHSIINSSEGATIAFSIGEHSFSHEVSIDSVGTSVESAKKLTTPRNINLTGDVSGSGTFDGSQDINIEVAVDKQKVLDELQPDLITTKNSILDYITYAINEDNTVRITGCDVLISGSHVIPSTLAGYPVTSIGYRAFYNCWHLAAITLPDSITSIGNEAFSTCISLTSVNIPDSITSIGEGAFCACTSIMSLTIPDNVTTIGEQAFYGCDSLTSVHIGSGVTSISKRAFGSCDALTTVTISTNLTFIGDYAFDSCTSLASINLPESITQIGNGAFYGCESLVDIFYEGSDVNWQNIAISENNEVLLNAIIHYNQACATKQFVIDKIADVSCEDVDTKIADAVSQQFNLYDADGDGSVNHADVAGQVAQPLEIYTSSPFYNTDPATGNTKIAGIISAIPSNCDLPAALVEFGSSNSFVNNPGVPVEFTGMRTTDIEAISILGGAFIGPVILPGLDVVRTSSESDFIRYYGDNLATNVADVNNIANKVVDDKLANQVIDAGDLDFR